MTRLSRLDILIVLFNLIVLIALSLALLGSREQNSRVAYLSPAFDGIPNVWMADIDTPDNAWQVTFSEVGIYNFDVSPDGRFLAYAEPEGTTGLTNLWMLDLQTNETWELVNCVAYEQDCKTPIFHPNGTMLAYERTDLSASADVTHLLSQVWLLDLTQTPNATYPSYEEDHLFGHTPTWSADGSRIAFYNPDGHDPGIVIYDFAPEDEIPLRFIPSSYGAMGTVSPNGEQIVFPTIIQRGEQMFTYLQFADLDQEALVSLTEADDPIDDVNAKWHPDGRHLAIARKYTDDRWTKGHQVYWLDSADGTIEPLVVDERYNTSSFTWNRDGSMLLMQRFPMLAEDRLTNEGATPEVWVYTMETGELTKITDNAFLPNWASG